METSCMPLIKEKKSGVGLSNDDGMVVLPTICRTHD